MNKPKYATKELLDKISPFLQKLIWDIVENQKKPRAFNRFSLYTVSDNNVQVVKFTSSENGALNVFYIPVPENAASIIKPVTATVSVLDIDEGWLMKL